MHLVGQVAGCQRGSRVAGLIAEHGVEQGVVRGLQHVTPVPRRSRVAQADDVTVTVGRATACRFPCWANAASNAAAIGVHRVIAILERTVQTNGSIEWNRTFGLLDRLLPSGWLYGMDILNANHYHYNRYYYWFKAPGVAQMQKAIGDRPATETRTTRPRHPCQARFHENRIYRQSLTQQNNLILTACKPSGGADRLRSVSASMHIKVCPWQSAIFRSISTMDEMPFFLEIYES